MTTAILPKNPDFNRACELIDSDDQTIWQPVVSYICQQHDIEETPFRCINGWANGIFMLENQLLIKIVPPNWIAQANSEIEALTLLTDYNLPVAIPRIKATGDINGWRYIVMDKLPGTNLHDIWPELAVENKIQIAKQVAQFARQLNQYPLSSRQLTTANSALKLDWPNFLLKQRENVYESRKKQGLSAALLADLLPFIDSCEYQAKSDLFNQGKPCLIHCDLHPGNLLAEKIGDSWQLSGVIDFGDAVIGTDPYFELTSPLLFLGQANKSINQAFLDSYGLTMTVDERQAFQQHLLVISLLRHSGDIGYPLKQVPGCTELADWQSISERFFAL